MKKLIYSMLLLVFTAGMASCQSSDAYKTIREKEFVTLSSQEGSVILDVRTPEEYAAGHIENAVSLDIYDANFSASIDTLDKSKTYLVYCKSGGRSANASDQLSSKGLKVYNLEGGISSWLGKVIK